MKPARKRGLGHALLSGRARAAASVAGILLGWVGEGQLIGVADAQGPNLPTSAGAVQPQRGAPVAPAAAEQPQKTYLNKGIIQLPIQIDDRLRSQIQEIRLFVKDRPGAAWTMHSKGSGAQTAFTFQAPRDGEYAFAMVTVDRQGRCSPADVAQEPPGLVVVVDRQAPQLDLQNLGSSPEGQRVQCDVRDANVDPLKTRFFYQTGDKQFRPLEPEQGRPNVWCVPAQAVFTGVIRVEAMDLAGNPVGHEGNVSQLSGARGVPAAAGTPTATPAGTLPRAINVPGSQNTPNAGPILSGQTQLPPAPVVDRVAHKQLASGAPDFVPDNPRSGEGSLTVPVSSPPDLQPITKTTIPARDPRRDPVPAQRLLVNRPHLFLEYQIEQAGASGVGKVEVWVTRDQGQSWQRLSEDADRKSPAEIDLPGEGLYGVTLVISNGRGFGATPPRPGEQPQRWIEVDTLKPNAAITQVRTVPDAGGAVHIAYRASDRNIASDGIDLHFATNRQGPWRLIARGLRNDGVYRWTPPNEAGAQAYLRLVVRDEAGNATTVETPQPVLLDDQSRPRGAILGVSTGPSASQSAGQGPSIPMGN